MHRGWMEHYLFKGQAYSEREAWEYCIANANFSPSKYRQAQITYDIPRGCIATSYRDLASKWKWSPNKAIRFLKLLQIENMISLKTEHNFVHIYIVNYDAYQSGSQAIGTDTEQERNTGGTRVDTETDTNVKKTKKVKEGQRKEYTSDFENLWTLYPRKDGSKAKAFQSYQTAIESGVDHGRIESGVIAHAESVCREATEQRFIKHLTTWLNQCCWESDYSAKPRVNGKSASEPSKSERARDAALRGVAKYQNVIQL